MVTAPCLHVLQLMYLAAQQQQNAAQKYDRSHPGAGRAGKGDQLIAGAEGINRYDRTSTRGPQQTYNRTHG